MALEKIKKMSSDEDSNEIVARAKHLNPIVDKVNTLSPTTTGLAGDTISELTSGAGVTVDGVLLKDGGIQLAGGVIQKEATIVIGATQIVGTSAEDLGHANGATLVAALGTSYTLELVSAMLLFNGMGTAYTGGADDTVIQLGTVAMTGVVAKADLLGATGDKISVLHPLAAAATSLTVNTALNIKSTTAWTQPGAAAGVLTVKIVYRIHPTGF